MRYAQLQIRHSAFGGFAILSGFEKRARIRAAIRRVIDWVVVA